MEFSDEDIEYFALALIFATGQSHAANKLATQLCEKYGTTDPIDWLMALTLICERRQKINATPLSNELQ